MSIVSSFSIAFFQVLEIIITNDSRISHWRSKFKSFVISVSQLIVSRKFIEPHFYPDCARKRNESVLRGKDWVARAAAKENGLRCFHTIIHMRPRCRCRCLFLARNAVRCSWSLFFFFRARCRRPDRLGQAGSLHPAESPCKSAYGTTASFFLEPTFSDSHIFHLPNWTKSIRMLLRIIYWTIDKRFNSSELECVIQFIDAVMKLQIKLIMSNCTRFDLFLMISVECHCSYFVCC